MARRPFIADQVAARCRAIHVARRQLDLDDATYRAILQRAAGVASTKDIFTLPKADAVLDEMRRLGFSRLKKVKPGQYPGTPHNIDREPMLQKIEALLADMRLPWAYADKVAENITGGKNPEAIKRLAWVQDGKHLGAIIAALSYEQDKRRLLAGVDELLQKAGKTRADAAAKIRAIAGDQYPRWERTPKVLRMVLEAIPQWWPEVSL